MLKYSSHISVVVFLDSELVEYKYSIEMLLYPFLVNTFEFFRCAFSARAKSECTLNELANDVVHLSNGSTKRSILNARHDEISGPLTKTFSNKIVYLLVPGYGKKLSTPDDSYIYNYDFSLTFLNLNPLRREVLLRRELILH